jgi:hypothetical protein
MLVETCFVLSSLLPQFTSQLRICKGDEAPTVLVVPDTDVESPKILGARCVSNSQIKGAASLVAPQYCAATCGAASASQCVTKRCEAACC